MSPKASADVERQLRSLLSKQMKLQTEILQQMSSLADADAVEISVQHQFSKKELERLTQLLTAKAMQQRTKDRLNRIASTYLSERKYSFASRHDLSRTLKNLKAFSEYSASSMRELADTYEIFSEENSVAMRAWSRTSLGLSEEIFWRLSSAAEAIELLNCELRHQASRLPKKMGSPSKEVREPVRKTINDLRTLFVQVSGQKVTYTLSPLDGMKCPFYDFVHYFFICLEDDPYTFNFEYLMTVIRDIVKMQK